MRAQAGPCRYIPRRQLRAAPVNLNEGPPAELVPALVALAGVTSVAEAHAIVEMVPAGDRAKLVAHMASRPNRFGSEAIRAAVAAVDEGTLHRELGAMRADNVLRVYG